jgi:vacuolar-type H+-ATPase subunit I/STV1
MVIETDARRFIVDAIALEQELTTYETEQKKKGVVFVQSQDYNKLREGFLSKMCEINAVANTMGKGRDDFKMDVLVKAEEISRKVSPIQSSAVRKLADQIKQTFHTFRVLVRKYNENVEVVDPQLKNNQELVEVLNDWEKAWTLGKEHLLDTLKC